MTPLYKTEPYQTLYLLHGLFGNYTDWFAGTRVQMLANAYNLCVVTPDGDNKFYCDSERLGEKYASFVGKELVEFTRRTFPLSARREDTFLGGLSMGGYGALTNGLRYPDTFGYIAAFSSALVKDRIMKPVGNAEYDYQSAQTYRTIFGLDDLKDFEGSENDYDELARRLSQSSREKPKIYMACGEQDELFSANAAYQELLKSLGYQVTWESWKGEHDWIFWDEAIARTMRWLPLDYSE